jgi:peptidoglycan/LPS O-acetylase OafA/YrhL
LAISLALSGINILIVPHIFSYPESQQYLLKNFVFLNFFGQLPVFIIGIFSYLVLREKHPIKQVAIVGGSILIVLLLAFLYPAFGFQNNFVGYMLFILPHHYIAGALFTAIAILLANWPTRLLVNKITKMFGKLSFSMYLTHFAVLTFFSKLGLSNIFPKSNLAALLHFMCVVLVAAVVSVFFYKCIEKPGISLGKFLIKKLENDVTHNPNLVTNKDTVR